MEAVGSVMTNKYSEGYPGARYYGGNEYVTYPFPLYYSVPLWCYFLELMKSSRYICFYAYNTFLLVSDTQILFAILVYIIGTLTWLSHYVKNAPSKLFT